MKSGNFPLRLMDDLKTVAAEQAAASGMSLNQFIATAVAARVGAIAEAERYFAGRAARTTPEQARAILMKAGSSENVRPDDRLDAPDD